MLPNVGIRMEVRLMFGFSLQHVVDPMKEERVQLDQSLTVWIVEAKHLPKKR